MKQLNICSYGKGRLEEEMVADMSSHLLSNSPGSHTHQFPGI